MRRSTANRLLAAFLFVAGLGFWSAAGWMIYRHLPTLKMVTTRSPAVVQMQEHCATAANDLGFAVNADGATLRVSMKGQDLSGLQGGFNRSSILIALCTGYDLQTFCAGSGCGANKLFLSLVPTNP